MNLENFIEKAAPKNRVALLAVIDAIVVCVSGFLALYIRYDFSFDQMEMGYVYAELYALPVYLAIAMGLFVLFRLYRSVWHFASAVELLNVIKACTVFMVVQILGLSLLRIRMPISYYMMKYMILIGGVGGLRFTYRILRVFKEHGLTRKNDNRKRTMIVGAGEAGAMIIKELQSSRYLNQNICCVVDDNPGKHGKYIRGIEIMGGREDIRRLAYEMKIDEIIVAMPSAPKSEVKEILNICKETDCDLKVMPGLYQLVQGEVSVSKLRKVRIEDLLGREPIKVQLDEIMEYVSGKVILVTGGGGSIGSELCRQVAAHEPKRLVIFDIYENNAYDIQQELKDRYPELELTVLIGSVRDSRRLQDLFTVYQPDIVYHAAAHKHVPLMEDSPCEAIKNNVIGTYKTAYAAMLHGCKRFVLISTDKAVNPTNIMGASKRLCEMVIQSFDRAVKTSCADQLPMLYTHRGEVQMLERKDFCTEFVAVRFGNVLGSNGSVVPLFKKQIAKGGPVTVTHPDIIRYFMTIPEAVSLVLQAGCYASGGEIFVLDMGEPVKIDELARNLIKLSGHRPDEDIRLVYTGLRPGEKLYEEKLMAEEGLRKTANALIHIGNPIPFDMEQFLTQLKGLMDAAYDNDPDIAVRIGEMVPSYRAPEAAVK